MYSLGNSSKGLQHDSLSPPACFMFSESGRTENKPSSGASSEGEWETGSGKPSPEAFTLARQAADSPETHMIYAEQQRAELENDPTGHYHRTLICTGLTSSATRAPKKGDFFRKCAELHGYVRPLLELLNGLKKGRYDGGLSMFQQSIAMDRLQRIVGILQKPPMGEKYMHTVLQLEMMLKVWFPRVVPRASTSLAKTSTSNPPSCWLPVKKRRLSWSQPEPQPLTYSSCKRIRCEDQELHPCRMTLELASPATAPITRCKDAVRRNEGPVKAESEDICSLVQGSSCLSSSETHAATWCVSSLVLPPPSTGGCCLDTQDCLVSSTTLPSDLC